MTTIDDAIAHLEHVGYEAQGVCEFLKKLRDSGVYVEQGTREWAAVMHFSGKKVKPKSWASHAAIDSDEELCAMIRNSFVGEWELAPPRLVERGPVRQWEACKAWHEGKEIRFEVGGGWRTKKTHPGSFSFDTDNHDWYIREPA